MRDEVQFPASFFRSMGALAAVLFATVVYGAEEATAQILTQERSQQLAFFGEAYLLVLAAAVAVFLLDVRRVLRSRVAVATREGTVPLSPGWLIPYVFSLRRYKIGFLASALAYGVFYAVVTSVVVYQPGIDFASYYGAAIPSVQIASCCGAPLLMPVVTVYIVNHLGLLLVPLTVLLLVGVSALVGLNFAMASFAFDNRARSAGRGWVGGLGAAVALFTGCPTCAGLFFANFVWGSGAVAFAAALTYYQGFFIALSLPVLAGTPYLISRSLGKVFSEGCVVVRPLQPSVP
ncbi:MAG: hypothetical protein HY247_07085 [archaeon]|nr:MAG: hypothetical protein HY247_07085 [archaeon]